MKAQYGQPGNSRRPQIQHHAGNRIVSARRRVIKNVPMWCCARAVLASRCTRKDSLAETRVGCSKTTSSCERSATACGINEQALGG